MVQCGYLKISNQLASICSRTYGEDPKGRIGEFERTEETDLKYAKKMLEACGSYQIEGSENRFVCVPELLYHSIIKLLNYAIIGKPPIETKDGYYRIFSCPNCKRKIMITDGYGGTGSKEEYCCECGQHIDWSE